METTETLVWDAQNYIECARIEAASIMGATEDIHLEYVNTLGAMTVESTGDREITAVGPETEHGKIWGTVLADALNAAGSTALTSFEVHGDSATRYRLTW